MSLQDQRISSAEYRQAQITTRRRSKFGNKRVTVGELSFDSIGEMRRWEELRLMELAGEITNLERQVRIPLIGARDMPILYESGQQAVYVCDFSYIKREDWTELHGGERRKGKVTIEDFKGLITPEAKLKMAIVANMMGRPVLISKAPTKRGRRG